MTFIHLRFALLLLLVLGASLEVSAQEQQADTIDPFILQSVEIVRQDVFDTASGEIPRFAANVLNALHIVTRERVVGYAVFVKPGDLISQATLNELEQSLRRLGIFSEISFEVLPGEGADAASDGLPRKILQIITRDSWSTQFSITLNTGGNAESYGGAVLESNLLGLGTQLSFGADYTSINNRQWRGYGTYRDPNLLGTPLEVSMSGSYSKLEEFAEFSFGHPFYALRVPFAFNTTFSYFDGTQFYYSPTDPVITTAVPTERFGASSWYSLSRGQEEEGGVFRTAFGIGYDRTIRDSMPSIIPAFENSIPVSLGISSLKLSYTRMDNVEFPGESLVPVGGMGNVSFGKIIPHNGGLDNMIFIGAEARQAARIDDLYLFGMVAGGTGLMNKEPHLTMFYASGRLAAKIGPGALVLRGEQSTIWNWNRYSVRILDDRNGLRGYAVNSIVGDNRFLFNGEYRVFFPFRVLFFGFGLAAFYDAGAVWNQGEQLSNARFHSSAGAGLRISNFKGSVGQGLLRIDVAYNFDERKVAQLILSTQQPFDLFGTLGFRAPGPYVP